MPAVPEALAGLLHDWLPSQRWFPAKGTDFSLRQLGSILLQDPADQVRIEVNILAVDSADRTDIINVPLTSRSAPLEGGEHALLGTFGNNADGSERWLYDGAHDPVFIAAWLELIRTESETSDGRARGQAYAGFADWQPLTAPLKAAVLSGEQSNTSVVIEAEGGDLILKLFRALSAGTNPDVEIGTLLTENGSREVPVTFGSVVGSWNDPNEADVNEADAAERAAGPQLQHGDLAVLREFIAGSQDAWRPASAAAVADADFTREAEEIGRATARIHASLRTAFGTRNADDAELRTFVEGLAGRIRWGWTEGGSAVGMYAQQIETVLAQLENLTELPPLQRIHADYHLGQVLHSAERGWVVLDFEGEPLREAEGRSVHDAALRDVVGMLRSLDYAAGVAAIEASEAERERVEAAAAEWSRRTREAFLAGYESESGEPVDTASPLFLGLMLDKALYEVVYELRNRPAWVKVPAAAVRQLVEHLDPTVQENAMADQNEVALSHEAQPAQGQFVGAAAAARTELAPSDAKPITVAPDVLAAVAHGAFYQPHAVLGAHLDDYSTVTVRTLRRLATSVKVITANGTVPMTHEYEGIWVVTLPAEHPGHVPDYRLEVTYAGHEPEIVDDPYRFLPTLGEIDLHLIGEGRHETLWTVLGAHPRRYASSLGEIVGTSFAVWAPNARAVRVMGDFNGWNGSVHAMRSLGGSGIWELFIPGVTAGACYKFEILGSDGHWREKADPMAFGTEVPPLTGSRVVESTYRFEDDEWMTARAARDPHNGPMSIYEVHLGSWRLGLGYRELAKELVDYVKWQGFTHVEFMPVAEHPFGGSWGYQVTSYFAPTSRFGHPDDFRYLVDQLHQAGIGVLVDWVPAHFPKDSWALAQFDGQALYEHSDPRLGEHPDWGTLIFDFGRREVRNFLVANALYWLEEFHVDGLRVDAVASMLYLDYSREAGQWVPNIHGGRENLQAISFLQEVNATAYKRVPGIVMIAEESTAFPGVTRPTSGGGLGFGLKWNMGWMHDSLEYIAENPINRVYHHNKMTFSMVYAYTENFLLPISHDEVVHGKGSMLRKMPGDRWQQLANLRAYLAFQWAHPGKQLIFMGTEFGQEAEWSEQHGLDWWLAETVPHKGLQHMVRELNSVYRDTPALYERDNEPAGFQWVDQNDGAHNTLSFIRWDRQGNPLVCVANFAGAPHENFQLGLPWAGSWVEALNTDSAEFGGSGVGNASAVIAKEQPIHGQPASAKITVPPLAVLYLKPEGKVPGLTS